MRPTVTVVIFIIIKVLDSVGNSVDSMRVQEQKDKLTLSLNRLYLLSRIKEENSWFTTTDPNIAEIKNGIILPKKTGKTLVMFYNKYNYKQKTLEVTIIPESEDTFDQMRQKWKDILLGDSFYDPKDSSMLNATKNLDDKALALWNTMNKNKRRQSLWNNYRTRITKTEHMTEEFERLEILAIAVMNRHSRHYLNRELLIDTISGLEWMRLKKYNAKIKTHGNWWDWEIGSPFAILNILTMLYPILADKEVSAYLTDIDRFVPNPRYINTAVEPHNTKAIAANQVYVSKVKILQNILRKQEKGFNEAKEALKIIFAPVSINNEKPDGFYADGSFLQHTDVAMTGSYGIVLLGAVSELFTVIQSTKYDAIIGEKSDIIFTWVNEAFAPLVYKGLMMDMVRGRDISREAYQSPVAGADLIRAIVNIAEISTKENGTEYKKMVKGWILQNDAYDYINGLSSYRDIFLAKKIIDDPSVPGKEEETIFKNYAMMNRVVYRNVEKDFALGISMCSKRVARFESLNDENVRGWYTGDGMVYLYNSDLSQYNDHFWATVDPYRLPGITVEKFNRKDRNGIDVFRTDFVGGSILDKRMGIIAMDFVNYGGSVSGRKSWSVFGNQVIALGSRIKNSGVNVVETVFENRKLNKAIQYELYINDKKVDISKPSEYIRDNVDSIYLEANDQKQSIGYKLLTPQKLTIKIENRSGAWSDINKGENTTKITRKYLTIWKTHNNGKDRYNYVFYPGILRTEFKQVKPAKIIFNYENIHAITDDIGNVGISLFVQKKYEIQNIEISQPMVLFKKNCDKNVKIALSDPTGRQISYALRLKNENYTSPVFDKNIKATLVNGFWQITIDLLNKFGQSSVISFNRQ